MDHRHFRLASPQIISETLDGEAVIINLDSGTYYSLDPIGSYVWDSAREGFSSDSLIATLAAGLGLGPPEVAPVVGALLGELQDEGLLVAEDSGRSEPDESRRPSLPPAAGGLTRPELSRYTDIQELLLLDPIHEVEESGWPAAKEKQGGS